MHGVLEAIRVLAVVGLLAGFLWWLRRYDRRVAQPARRKTVRPVEVLGQARLSRQATVAVVRVGERSLTLGVTEHGVNLLAESDYVAPAVEPAEEKTPFVLALQQAAAGIAPAVKSARARTEGTVPAPAPKNARSAAGASRSTAARARKPKQPVPQ